MNFRKFKKNAKGLSPVVASIILIAVTVAVSVVVAAWMGGMTIGLMGNAEQASITNTVLTNVPAAGANPAVSQAVVTVQNTGSATVDISSATIDGNTATITAATVTSGTQTLTWTSGQVPISKGCTVTITMTIPAATESFVDSAQYTIKLMTAKGNTVTNTATYNGP
jgi:flagellin-like protein